MSKNDLSVSCRDIDFVVKYNFLISPWKTTLLVLQYIFVSFDKFVHNYFIAVSHKEREDGNAIVYTTDEKSSTLRCNQVME